MALSGTACRNAHSHEKVKLGKQLTLFDSLGLSLLVKPGKKVWIKAWRLKYRFEGKDLLLALGTYPTISLSLAREQRDTIRKQIALGIDPIQHKEAVKAEKIESAANSFEAIAAEWLLKKNKDKSTRPKWILNHLLPYIGYKPIDSLKPKDVLARAQRLEERKINETAHRTLQIASQIFRFAVATGRAER